MKILLTGGTGFLGSHLAEELCRRGHELLLIKRVTSDLWRCASIAHDVKWVDTDSPNLEDCICSFRPETIINAGWSGVAASSRDNWNIQIENIQFQQRLLDIALKTGVKKIIGFGSQAEYGPYEGRIDETYAPAPYSAYGAVKLSSQIIMESFCNQHGITWYWFRLYSCFGEKEADNWLIPLTVKTMLTEKAMDLTLGEQRYSYLYIKDVARLIASSIDQYAPSGIYHIASDSLYSIKDILVFIREYLNPDFHLNFGALPYRPGQPMINGSINEKTKSAFGNYEISDFTKSLTQTIEYYKQKYHDER